MNMNRNYASTHLRLYAQPDVQSKTLSAGDVQNGVGFVGALLQHLYRLSCRKNEQFDLASRGFTLHLVHHREPALSAGANYQAAALPGYFFPDREGCMTEGVTEFLGRFFLPLADLPMIDHHIVLVSNTVDPNRAESKILETH
jgi:hypothetical protein